MISDTAQIAIQRIERSRLGRFDFNNIPFGKIFSDHMFVADWSSGEWSDARIVPYGPMPMSPALAALHYGQAIFEGLKAYKGDDGEVRVSRPADNIERMNKSAVRMCMPEFPVSLYMEGLTTMLDIDRGWVPSQENASLYIRPVQFATVEEVKVKPSETYRFVIMTCPVGPYYTEPIRVKVEMEFIRAADGGTGFAKAAGNYGGALYPAKLGQDEGYHQLIWTDAKEHKYIEESGTMNVVFVIDEVLVTPPTGNRILSGITRDSVLSLARDRGMPVEERRITVDEVIKAIEDGRLKEAAGVGTAATVSHISVIGYHGVNHELPPIDERGFLSQVKTELEEIRRGRVADRHEWMLKI